MAPVERTLPALFNVQIHSLGIYYHEICGGAIANPRVIRKRLYIRQANDRIVIRREISNNQVCDVRGLPQRL